MPGQEAEARTLLAATSGLRLDERLLFRSSRLFPGDWE